MTEAPDFPADAVARLLDWFAAGQRVLPWRDAPPGERAPYRVWIAEIMLQQTRVDVVVPYYEAWMRAFPTVEALAAADEDLVLRHWAGLGYYRRARLLHRAAQELVARGARGSGGAGWPGAAADWRELSGIGEYTSAALASLAGHEAAPVVDGNVKRVAARVLGRAEPADARSLHRAAAAWVAAGMRNAGAEPGGGGPPGFAPGVGGPLGFAPGALNEALMELGATVCTPRAPTCEVCPLSGGCAAAGADAEAYPAPKKAVAWKEVRLVYGLARAGDRVTLVQRDGGWNPGLWEPPSQVLEPGGGDAWRAWQEARRPGVLGDKLGEVRHTITRHRIRADVHALESAPDDSLRDPDAYGLTALARKMLRRWPPARG